MQDDNILNILDKTEQENVRRNRRAVICQAGAIGDSVLTLPLAEFLKEKMQLGAVDILGHTEYISIFPGRTCINTIKSIETANLHKLHANHREFEVPDNDPLLSVFSQYTYIISFLAEPDSDFERNLIYTVNCCRSAEVISLPFKPAGESGTHIAGFHIKNLSRVSDFEITPPARPALERAFITPLESDYENGRELLRSEGIEPDKDIVVIHPGSGSPAKCWYIENFLRIAKILTSENLEVLFVLGPAELEKSETGTIRKIRSTYPTFSNLNLTQLLGLLTQTSTFVGNDSGISHLAGAMNKRCFVLFGASEPEIYRPLGEKVTVIRNREDGFTSRTDSKIQARIVEKILSQPPA